MNTPFKAAVSTPAPAPQATGARSVFWIWLAILIPGLALVGWRATLGAEARRQQAASLGQTLAARMESQIQSLAFTAETLGLAARRSGPAFADFQTWAAELQRTRPGWVVMEYQPGGVVRDVAPRTGFARLVGVSALNDPNQRASFLAAAQARSLTLAAPVRLPGNANGIVARVPILTRGADGRDQVTAYVSVSMKMEDVAQRAGLGNLTAEGFQWLLFAAAPTGQKSRPLLNSGKGPFGDAVQTRLQAGGLDWRLAVRPIGNWVPSLQVVLESLLVLVLAGCAGWLVQDRRRQAHTAESLREASRSLARAGDEQRKAQEACRLATEKAAGLQAELARARAQLGDTEFIVADLHGKMENHARATDEAYGTLQARVKEGQGQIANLKTQLGHAEAALEESRKTREAEMVMARLAADKSQQTIADLEARLDQAGTKQKELAATHQAELEAAQARGTELEKKLSKLEKTRERETIQARERETVLEARIKELETTSVEAANAKPEANPGETPPPTASAVSEPDGEAPAPNPPTLVEPPPSEPVPEPAPEAETQPAAEEKPAAARVSKRKRSRRDSQMDLFGGPGPEASGDTEVQARVEDNSQPTPEPVQETPAVGPEPEAEEPKEPEGDLPRVEGLNATSGLASARGHARNYLASLRRFQDHEGSTTNRIRDALEGGDSEKAQALTEGLAARGAEIGAEGVETAARALARSIHDQAHPDRIEFLWGDLDRAVQDLIAAMGSALKPWEDRPVSRRPRAAGPVDLAQLRKAVNEIVPLLAEGDPGAKDCFKANKAAFQGAFTVEGFDEFEEQVRRNKFADAYETLKRTAKRHGLSS